ncbi:MAG: glycoside hydrolase family 127 protein, partial [Clostridia bacterium]
DVFSSYPKELGHFGFNPSQIMGLCELAQETKNEKYTKLAEVFVNMRGSQAGGTDQNQDKTPLRDEVMPVGHAVTSTYLYAGATDVYSSTGEYALFVALERIWKDMVAKRMYITGGVCPDFIGHSERGNVTFESHATEYVLPNKIAYNESCANIGAVMWMMRMLAVTGDTKYGDWAEQILYNAGISGSNLSLTRYFYSNPLAYRKDVQIPYIVDVPNNLNVQYAHKATRRWHTFTCWCCPPQLFRTMAGVGRWIYGDSDSEVFVNLFANCDYEGKSAKLSMKTNYPWDGKITIDVEKADNTKVNLRIPAWCKNAVLNGQSVPSGGYAQVSVNTGDLIELDLPMAVRFMQANANVEQDRGMICIQRGPIVYCAEACDNTVELDNIYLDPKAEYRCSFEGELLNGVVTIKTDAVIRTQQDTLYYELVTEEERKEITLIPYYTWANREESDMSVWFPKA